MDSKHHEFVSFYKKIEAEINKRIHTSTNSRAFTLACGNALEAHLRKVRVHRRLTTRWLKRLNLANKDELAAISNRLVDCEGTLDVLDEVLFSIRKMQEEHNLQLQSIRRLLEEWAAFLNKEVKVGRDSKISSLEQDLLELKLLFNIKPNMEEIEDDGET